MNLTKHHGLGNDFLVQLATAEEAAADPVDGARARALCDRRTGIGADGLIRSIDTAPGAVRMELWNSDGSRAELSGNGMRCLMQAALLSGRADDGHLVISTPAGDRQATLDARVRADTHQITVEMGAVRHDGPAPQWEGDGVTAAATADIGNPHLVLHVPDPDVGPDLVAIGTRANEQLGGVNVELIRVEGDGLALTVFERGAGVTQACGTGACAAAAVAHEWGLVGAETDVVMPGGTARVRVGDEVTLTGPTTVVARVEVPDGGW